MSTSKPNQPNAEKCQAAHASAAMAANLRRGILRIAGADRIKLLQNLSTADLAKLPVGRGSECIFLDAKGRIVDYVCAFKTEDAIWCDVEPERTAGFVKHLDRYVIREDVRFDDLTGTLGQLAIVGPQAAALLEERLGIEVANLANPSCVEVNWQGAAVQVRRHDIAVVPTFQFLADTRTHSSLSAAFAGLPTLDEATLELLRIEAGLPRMGIDVEVGNLAQEVGRNEQAISFVKGCYLGQETVARMDALGHVNRQVQGIVFERPAVVERNASLFLGEKLAGHVTSAALSPGLGTTIGLAMLRTAGVQPGTSLESNAVDGPVKATVTRFPLQ